MKKIFILIVAISFCGSSLSIAQTSKRAMIENVTCKKDDPCCVNNVKKGNDLCPAVPGCQMLKKECDQYFKVRAKKQKRR